jgi:hypothetical protein
VISRPISPRLRRHSAFSISNPYQADDVKRADGCIAGAGWPSENKE